MESAPIPTTLLSPTMRPMELNYGCNGTTGRETQPIFRRRSVLSPDGRRVFVTGYSYSRNSFSDYATIAYDAASGVEIWLRRYNNPINGFDFAYALALSPDGTKLFVTGSCDEIDTGTDFVTLAYDAATGKRLWRRRYNGPANNSDSPSAIAVSPDGTKVFVTGLSSGAASPDFPFDYTTIAYQDLRRPQLMARSLQWVGKSIRCAR